MLAIPVHVWMKAGIAAEICTNPVFINKKNGSDHEPGELLNLLRERFLLLFIHDPASNASLQPKSVVSSIIPEKLIFEDKKYRTTKMNEVLALILRNSDGPDNEVKEKGQQIC
jgi:hypothetical protein